MEAKMKWIVNREKQAILTPDIHRILECLMRAQNAGARIYSVCPHIGSIDRQGNPQVFIVIVDEHYQVEE